MYIFHSVSWDFSQSISAAVSLDEMRVKLRWKLNEEEEEGRAVERGRKSSGRKLKERTKKKVIVWTA